MPNRSRTATDFLDSDVEDAETKKPRGAKKPSKQSKSAPRKRLRSGGDAPSILPRAAPISVNVPATVAEAPSVGSDAAIERPDSGLDQGPPEAAGETIGSVQTGEPYRITEESPLGMASDPPSAPAPAAEMADSPSWAENKAALAADQENGESPMNEGLKQHVQARDTWIRFAYMILFGAVFYIGQFVVGLVAVVQFLHKLLTGAPHARLAVFGAGLAAYYREIVEFLSYQSERIPFPFSPWPRTATSDSDQSNRAREAAPN